MRIDIKSLNFHIIPTSFLSIHIYNFKSKKCCYSRKNAKMFTDADIPFKPILQKEHLH